MLHTLKKADILNVSPIKASFLLVPNNEFGEIVYEQNIHEIKCIQQIPLVSNRSHQTWIFNSFSYVSGELNV